jgi:hypothetical protein
MNSSSIPALDAQGIKQASDLVCSLDPYQTSARLLSAQLLRWQFVIAQL